MRLNNGLWLFKDRVTLSLYYGRTWDMSEMKTVDVYTNKWRIGDRCFSGTLRIWRLQANITIWSMPLQNSKNNMYDAHR